MNQIVQADGSNSQASGTTIETLLKSVVIKGGLMGPSDALYVEFVLETASGFQSPKLYFGGSSLQITGGAGVGTVSIYRLIIINQGVGNQLIGGYSAEDAVPDEIGTVSGAGGIFNIIKFPHGLFSIDTSQDQTLKLTITPAAMSETYNLRGWVVSLLTSGV